MKITQRPLKLLYSVGHKDYGKMCKMKKLLGKDITEPPKLPDQFLQFHLIDVY